LDDMPEALINLIDSDLPPAQKCFSFIREGILLGYLKKGHRIVERELVDLLKVSRTPIREAVRRLEKENLISHHLHRGCVVSGFTTKDIKEMYELRTILECFLMRKLVESPDIAAFETLKQKMQDERASGQKIDTAHTGNFHMRLLGMAKHRWLSYFLGQLEDYISRLHVLSFLKHGRDIAAFQEHLSILDALIAKDADAAEKLLIRHINASLDAFLDVYQLV